MANPSAHHRPSRTRWLAAACAISAAALTAHARATAEEAPPADAIVDEVPGRPALLIDDGLNARRVRLVSLDEKNVEFIDELQRRRKLARSGVLAFIIEPDADEPPRPRTLRPVMPQAWSSKPINTTGMLVTVGGQQFPGAPAALATQGENFAWDIPNLGRLELPLERMRFARTESSNEPAPVAAPASDTIVLTNGDRLSGFLVSAGQRVRFEPAGADPVEFEPQRVAALILSNPASAPRGPRVWLEGGVIADVRTISIDPEGRMLLSLEAGPTGSFEWSKLTALSLDAARLVPLSSLAVATEEPTGGRRWTPPMRLVTVAPEPGALPAQPLDAADIELPAPMRVRWTLPAGVSRFSAALALAPGSAPWGDCEVVIKADTREVFRRRVVAGNDRVNVNVEIPGRSLTIEVEPGRYGPIKDRVIISRPLLMIGRDAE